MSTAKLEVNNQEYELPLVVGSENETGVNVRKLRAASGAITYDPGYGNTGSCSSAITFIDGEKGILRYRGYPIEQLAVSANFLEVAYLLIVGKLPTEDEFAGFVKRLNGHTMIHEDMKKFFEGYPPTAHPMAILSSMVSALSTYYRDTRTPEDINLNIVRLIAKAITIAAFSYKKSIGQPFVYPINSFNYTENFLAGRAVRGPRGGQRRAQHAANPARRSRTELLDGDGAHGGQQRGQPFRLDLGGHQRPVRAAARRRQPESDRDAAADPQRRQRPPEVRRQGQGQERSVPPHGLRPPRLQELRPAGAAAQAGGRQRSRRPHHAHRRRRAVLFVIGVQD
jgi:hypothetical protein